MLVGWDIKLRHLHNLKVHATFLWLGLLLSVSQPSEVYICLRLLIPIVFLSSWHYNRYGTHHNDTASIHSQHTIPLMDTSIYPLLESVSIDWAPYIETFNIGNSCFYKEITHVESEKEAERMECFIYIFFFSSLSCRKECKIDVSHLDIMKLLTGHCWVLAHLTAFMEFSFLRFPKWRRMLCSNGLLWNPLANHRVTWMRFWL